MAIVCDFISGLISQTDLWMQDITTPVHELFLSFAGIVFSLTIGSFFLYHVYLIS